MVSLIAPEKEIIPPALFVAANADDDNIATDNNDSGSLFLNIYNSRIDKYLISKNKILLLPSLTKGVKGYPSQFDISHTLKTQQIKFFIF